MLLIKGFIFMSEREREKERERERRKRRTWGLGHVSIIMNQMN